MSFKLSILHVNKPSGIRQEANSVAVYQDGGDGLAPLIGTASDSNCRPRDVYAAVRSGRTVCIAAQVGGLNIRFTNFSYKWASAPTTVISADYLNKNDDGTFTVYRIFGPYNGDLWDSSVDVVECNGEGVNGKSAYELAVQQGFKGTLADWLGSLKGKDGSNGITPDFRIGNVATLAPGSQATATITGTADKPVLNLGIPKGADGSGGGGGLSPLIGTNLDPTCAPSKVYQAVMEGRNVYISCNISGRNYYFTDFKFDWTSASDIMVVSDYITWDSEQRIVVYRLAGRTSGSTWDATQNVIRYNKQEIVNDVIAALPSYDGSVT